MTICATDRYTQLISLADSLIGKIFLFARCTRPTGDKEPAMNRPRRLKPILFVGLALLTLSALPACGTKNVSADTVLRDNNLLPGPNQGSVLLVFAPLNATYAEYLAGDDPGVPCIFLIDGKKLVDSDGEVQLIYPEPGAGLGAGNSEAGVHHFAITQMDGGTVFEGDGLVTSGALTRLYVFGPLNALQGRFVSYPLETPAGSAHISAINLVRSGGVQIEVVSCTDATTCAPVSPPLALGDTFDADFPASGPADAGVHGSSLSADGVGFGYREVATALLPAPPILPLLTAESGLWHELPGVRFVAAPEFLLADGTNPTIPVD
jgi:hypothetical protein